MFSFFKKHISNFFSRISTGLSTLFGRATVDQNTLEELRAILIQADTGAAFSAAIIEQLKTEIASGKVHTGSDLKYALEQQLIKRLDIPVQNAQAPVVLLVGVNGCGKTTLAAKLAHKEHQGGNHVTLAAADTFRAAAPEQLSVWATRTDSTLIQGTPNQDPASVVYTAAQAFKEGHCDRLIIDTAGRLQTKSHLMAELAKMRKVLAKLLPDTPVHTMLTIDAMLGQNSMEQARLFHEATAVDSIVLTKMDGTGKGGIVFAIAQELSLPVSYMSFGETPESLQPFNAQQYVQQLLES